MMSAFEEILSGYRCQAGSVQTALRPRPGAESSADRVLALPGLAVVCDGVSRTHDPAAAADAAATAVLAHVTAQARLDLTTMGDAIHAGQRVADQLAERDTATTVTVAAVIVDSSGARHLLVAWVGDSPAGYLTEDGQAVWVTTPDARHDHQAFGDRRVQSAGPLGQVVGPGRTIMPNTVAVPLPDGAVVIAASDGVLGGRRPVSERQGFHADCSAAALAEAAWDDGSRDDVGVALIRPAGNPQRTGRPPRRGSWWRARRFPP